jgi:hypothetical protein
MTNYWPTIDKRETREIIQQDCYRTRAQSSLDDDSGGRFAKVNPSKVTGAEPISYPQQPEGSPWRCDPVPSGGVLDTTGYDINAVEPILDEPTPNSETEAVAHPVSDDAAAASSPWVAAERPEVSSPFTSGQGRNRRLEVSTISPQPSSTKPFQRRF